MAFCSFGLGVGHSAQMSDCHTVGLHSDRLQHVELLLRALAHVGVSEDRQIRRQMRLADGAKYFPLIGGHRIPRSDFAKRADGLRLGLSHQFLSDLFLAPTGQ